MGDKPKIRRVFPGANTSMGFYSFYDYILPQDKASRIFIIKGGPGTGKSTFMTKTAEDIVKMGFDVEYHQCSSDNDSLDGIVIPALKTAIIDGTAPHVFDPKNPGAVDEIINLGEYWDGLKMEAFKDEIIETNKRTAKLFRIAYSHLKEAKVAYDEWKGYISESINRARYNEITKVLLDNIFGSIPDNFESCPQPRHLFASAITPGGLKNYIDTLVPASMKSFAVEGEPGTGVKEMIMRVAQAAAEKGLYTEQFHCPFEPQYLDMVIIPRINTVVLNMSKPFHYNIPKIDGLRVEDRINLNICIQNEALKEYQPEIDDAKKRFYSLIASAVEHLSRAKAVHDTMEKYYISSMNFNKIEEKRQEIVRRILASANQPGCCM